jgi:hypothetical protein
MGSTRIYGKQLRMEIDGTDQWADTISCVLKNEDDGDTVVTFEDAAAGETKKYFFEITAIQSTDATSLWSYIWDNTGDDVAFEYAPHGNSTITSAQPHVIGTLTIGAKPDLGGEAGRKKQQTFTTRFDIVGTPTLDRVP